jgi:hypothetical protein
MTRPKMVAILGLLLAAPLGAATADAQGLGYAIAGPAGFSGFFGSSASAVHVAGGGEVLFKQHVGVGGER